MGGCRCSYKNCKNTTKTTENVHFFHYPVKHKERCRIWIQNANKPHFCDLEEEQLRNKVICETHFEDRWFLNTQKKRLLQGAIPSLDGGAEEESSQPPPLYFSTELQDVQVLPANDDGTIFVLDTESIFSRSQKVESYIYKNGLIVPSKQKEEQKTCVAKPSTSTSKSTYSILNSKYELPTKLKQQEQLKDPIGDESEGRVTIKKEIPEYNESGTSKSIPCQSTTERLAYQPEQINFEEEEQEHIFETSNSNFSHKKVGPRSGAAKCQPKTIEKSVGRNYLRKIKQHSRDIASIKRMLKQKAHIESKPDMATTLNSLKEQLPPTFFTVLNLNLDTNCDLTDDDVDFFTTIHKTSPEVYQLLIDKYKWNLPCVNIVETPME